MAKKMKITTIQLQEEIREKLEKKKLYPRESYNDVVERMLEDEETPSMQEMFRRADKLKQDKKYTTKEIVKMIRDARENAAFH